MFKSTLSHKDDLCSKLFRYNTYYLSHFPKVNYYLYLLIRFSHPTVGMGNSRSSLQLQEEDINTIQAETGFNQNQIERLYSRWRIVVAN